MHLSLVDHLIWSLIWSKTKHFYFVCWTSQGAVWHGMVFKSKPYPGQHVKLASDVVQDSPVIRIWSSGARWCAEKMVAKSSHQSGFYAATRQLGTFRVRFIEGYYKEFDYWKPIFSCGWSNYLTFFAKTLRKTLHKIRQQGQEAVDI